MSFESNKYEVISELKKLGIPYCLDERNHKISANGYTLTYNNGYYCETGADSSLGRGNLKFINLVQDSIKS